MLKSMVGHSPLPARAKMRADGIPPDERPSDAALKWHRPKRHIVMPKAYPSECIGQLKQFLESPPEGVHIYSEHVIVTEDKVRIPFSINVAQDEVVKTKLPSFLMDFTFKTNKEGLLLGAVGPVSLRCPTGAPHMRFLPSVFLVCDAEDEEAQRLCVRLYLDVATEAGYPVTDAFLDCSCFSGAAAECGEAMYLHRCLQHVKKNIKAEAARKDPATGQRRLDNTELANVIVTWIEFSAWLPDWDEFDAFWREAFKRMENSASSTDWNEPAMAKYLKEHIFDMAGPLIKAYWVCGLGAVPLGFTTFAPNAIESYWRLLKGMLDPGYQNNSIAELMFQVCHAMETRVEGGSYKELVDRIDHPWESLLQRKKPACDTVVDLEKESANQKEKRLDANALLKYYREHGAEKTFLLTPCSKVLSNGETAELLYVLPKYQMRFAEERLHDMAAVQRLGVAMSPGAVQAACVDPVRRTYSLQRHIYLRLTFVTVYVTVGGNIVDTHKHCIEGGGHSEHCEFIRALRAPDGFIQPVARGPKNSRPRKGKRPKAKAKLSARTRAMLAAPAASDVSLPLQIPEAPPLRRRRLVRLASDSEELS